MAQRTGAPPSLSSMATEVKEEVKAEVAAPTPAKEKTPAKAKPVKEPVEKKVRTLCSSLPLTLLYRDANTNTIPSAPHSSVLKLPLTCPGTIFPRAVDERRRVRRSGRHACRSVTAAVTGSPISFCRLCAAEGDSPSLGGVAERVPLGRHSWMVVLPATPMRACVGCDDRSGSVRWTSIGRVDDPHERAVRGWRKLTEGGNRSAFDRICPQEAPGPVGGVVRVKRALADV